MKNTTSAFIAILSLLGIISCGDDFTDNSINSLETSAYSAFDNDKLRILSMGLDTTDIIDAGEYYVVEEDITINKDSLNKYQETRQYHATYTVATGQTITIGVSSLDLLNSWGTELTKVAEIYTEYTGNVFKFIGYDTNADIVISKEVLSYSLVCAEGSSLYLQMVSPVNVSV